MTGLRIVAKAAGGETFASKRAATIAYFLVTILICIATLALYWLHLRRLPVYIEHTKAAAAARAEVRTASLRASSILPQTHCHSYVKWMCRRM